MKHRAVQQDGWLGDNNEHS